MYKKTIIIGAPIMGILISILVIWPILHDRIFKHYIFNQIEQCGGLDSLTHEADSLIHLVNDGAIVNDVLFLQWISLKKLGMLDIRKFKGDIPTHIRIYRGGHFDKYYIQIFSSKDGLKNSSNNTIRISRNIRVVGKKIWSINW